MQIEDLQQKSKYQSRIIEDKIDI